MDTLTVKTCPQGYYKTFFMFNSIEHGISTAHKNKNAEEKKAFSCLTQLSMKLIKPINVKMPTIY